MTTRSPESPWLPFHSRPDAALRLFCLPHAGAGASAFRPWGALLPGVDVCPVQPPGRESRRSEAPFDAVGPIAEALTDAVLASLDVPYAVLGHSTGAIVAFELCQEIRRRGGPPPDHLFVSGRRAPHLPENVTGFATMSDEDVAAVLREHGGTPEQVLAAPGMITVLRELLAADFAVSERYHHVPEPPLPTPITAFAASADPRATTAQMAAWVEQTSSDFTLCPLVGGHFAVFEEVACVRDAIATELRVDVLEVAR